MELQDPVYARRFYSTYEVLEESILKVWDSLSSSVCVRTRVYVFVCVFFCPFMVVSLLKYAISTDFLNPADKHFLDGFIYG